MPSRRSDIEMTPAEVDAYLNEGGRSLNIATIGPTGHPHLVAMWYAMQGPNPVFWTFGKAQKILNLRRDPRMTGLVESGTKYSQLKGVELVGHGRIVEDYDEIVAIAMAVGPRYNGGVVPDDAAIEFLRKQAHKRLGVVLEVERVVSWDHTKLGGTY